MTEERSVRDAIVLSGWTWEAFNVPERIALALAHAGARVLYCENPVSLIREARSLVEVSQGVFAFRPKFLSHRLNKFSVLSKIQAQFVAQQVCAYASNLKLRDPVLVYPHGDYCLALCREFKRRRVPLMHVCMDYEPTLQIGHAQESDMTFAIPRASFDELKARFGEKVRLLPQFSSLENPGYFIQNLDSEAPELSNIPRPRLGYLGNPLGRVSLTLLDKVLSRHPEWQFLAFGTHKLLPLPNERVLPWRGQNELFKVLIGLDIGFMPYDCSHPKNLHCVPLKMFDYFALGMPVVSTPIVAVREYADLVYLGATPNELAEAISLALKEPKDSPKRAKRMTVARDHSIDSLAPMLGTMLINAAESHS